MNTPMSLLTGTTGDHVVTWAGSVCLHPQVVVPFGRLRQRAARHGITLSIASGFRDFHRQLGIWNAKARGERPVYSSDGSRILDPEEMEPAALMFAILRWSALPGTSRHHWGTDMDVWDAGAVEAGYQLQLTPEEYRDNGPFAALGQWLASPDVAQLGFYRPYSEDRNGVSPEPWHLSYRPLADRFAAHYRLADLETLITASDIALKTEILANLDEIYHRFVRV